MSDSVTVAAKKPKAPEVVKAVPEEKPEPGEIFQEFYKWLQEEDFQLWEAVGRQDIAGLFERFLEFMYLAVNAPDYAAGQFRHLTGVRNDLLAQKHALEAKNA